MGFGEDALGELYVVDLGGKVFRIVTPAAPVPLLPPWGIPLLAASIAAAATRLRTSGARGSHR